MVLYVHTLIINNLKRALLSFLIVKVPKKKKERKEKKKPKIGFKGLTPKKEAK